MNFIVGTILFKLFFKKYLRAIAIAIVLFCGCSLNISASQVVTKAELQEDDFLLLDVMLDKTGMLNSLEAYAYKDKMLLSVEFLFDALGLKYQIKKDELEVWKENTQYILPLINNGNVAFIDNNTGVDEIIWATDEYALYIDSQTLSAIFDSDFLSNTYKLRLEITTNKYLFPTQVIDIQNNKRKIAELRSLKDNTLTEKSIEIKAPEITIPDEYRLFTIPHGRIRAQVSADKNKTKYNGQAQLTSDLLYHTANLTLSQTKDSDLGSNLTLSRYKKSKDDLILGAFDSYSIGDVTSGGGNLTSGHASGLGVSVVRNIASFRKNNSTTTLEEIAPPGWDAELYHNGALVINTKVPNNGRLVFEDVASYYGHNFYVIKLYGPFGEEERIEKNVNLTGTSLAKGSVNYNLFALDENSRVISNQSDESIGFTDFGGSINLGITDSWQAGVGISTSEEINGSSTEFYSVKNVFSIPGYLIENDISFNQDFDYAQNTSIIGNAFGTDTFALNYESSDNFSSDRVQGAGIKRDFFGASYAGNIYNVPYAFQAEYETNNEFSLSFIRNRISKSFSGLHFTHGLTYRKVEYKESNQNVFLANTESILGQISIGGGFSNGVRLSGSVNYDPKNMKDASKSTVFNLSYSPTLFGIKNNFNARYAPLTDNSGKWNITHNLLLDTKEYLFNFSSSYDANDNWQFSAGVSFFLGYDYHNNRLIFRNKASQQTATLNVHTYLDRQINGVPDPLDFNLADVNFTGTSNWDGITSGVNGRTILAGTPVGGEFRFGAQWKSGSQTVLNDYVISTHPGAYVDVNIPFYLTNEIIGFVERSGNGEPLMKVEIELSGSDIDMVTETDEDGYYEFINLPPDEYTVKVSSKYLDKKNYTSEVLGFKLNTPKEGGFVEIDIIKLERISDGNEKLAEKIDFFEYTENNSDALVKDKDELMRRNYFSLPLKERVKAKHSLTQLLEDGHVKNGTAVETDVFTAIVNTVTGFVGTPIEDTSLDGKVVINENGESAPIIENNKQEVASKPAVNKAKIDGDIVSTLVTKAAKVGMLPTLNFYAKPESLVDLDMPITPSINLEREDSLLPSTESSQASNVTIVSPLAIEPDIKVNSKALDIQPVSNSQGYTLQMGAYRSKNEADDFVNTIKVNGYSAEVIIESLNSLPLYQVIFGYFDSREQASDFATNNITSDFKYFIRGHSAPSFKLLKNIESMPNAISQGWVIQFSASKSPINRAQVEKSHSTVENLYVAINKNSSKDRAITNYLLSEVYESKALALDALNQIGISGWVRKSALYSKITKI